MFTLCGYFCLPVLDSSNIQVDEREGADHIEFNQPEASLSHPSISQFGITEWLSRCFLSSRNCGNSISLKLVPGNV